MASIKVTAIMVSGRSSEVDLAPNATCQELQRALKDALELDSSSAIRILLDGKELPRGALSAGVTLQEVGLQDGARLEVMVAQPIQVPPVFNATLEACRRISSSAFIARYTLAVDAPSNTVGVEKWRRNDHDAFTVNTAAGVVSGYRQHWMCGDTPFERKLGFEKPLTDLLEEWSARVAPAPTDADALRFWARPGAAPAEDEPYRYLESDEDDDEADLTKFRPCRHNGQPPGWFETPSDDCVELVVNAEMTFMTLLRVLLDADGNPIRAAVAAHCPNHDKVEEYTVELTALRARRGDAGILAPEDER